MKRYLIALSVRVAFLVSGFSFIVASVSLAGKEERKKFSQIIIEFLMDFIDFMAFDFSRVMRDVQLKMQNIGSRFVSF